MVDDDMEVQAYYVRHSSDEESIRIHVTGVSTDMGTVVDLDIRDALFLQWQLAGAIGDYERAVGR